LRLTVVIPGLRDGAFGGPRSRSRIGRLPLRFPKAVSETHYRWQYRLSNSSPDRTCYNCRKRRANRAHLLGGSLATHISRPFRPVFTQRVLSCPIIDCKNHRMR